MAGNFTESSTTWPTPLPPITIIPTLDALGRAQVLDILFEPSTPLHALVLPLLEERPFQSYPELIAAVGQQLRSLQKSSVPGDKTRLRKILEAHPRLGEKRVEDLSESSRTEEEAMHIASDLAAAGDSDETADRERMLAMNDEYEAAFAGLRYVYVHVPRPFILQLHVCSMTS